MERCRASILHGLRHVGWIDHHLPGFCILTSASRVEDQAENCEAFEQNITLPAKGLLIGYGGPKVSEKCRSKQQRNLKQAYLSYELQLTWSGVAPPACMIASHFCEQIKF